MKRKILKLLALALPISLISFSASSKTRSVNAVRFDGATAVQIGRTASQDEVEFYCDFPAPETNVASLQINLNNLNFIAGEWASAMKIVNNTTAPLTVSLKLTGQNVIKSGPDYFSPIRVESTKGSDVDIFIMTDDENGASLTLGTVRTSGNPVVPISFEDGFQGRIILYNCIETTSKTTFDNTPLAMGTSKTYNFIPHTHVESNPPAERSNLPSCSHLYITESLCAECGEYAVIDVDQALDHQFQAVEVEGGTKMICSVCGVEKQTCEEHIWTFSEVLTRATCDTDGIATYVCERCGDTKVDTIPATGHNWEWIIDQDATCQEAGYKHQKCANCGLTTTATLIPKKDHTYTENDFIDHVEANCDHGGYSVYECSVCGQYVQVDNEYEPRKDHERSLDDEVTVVPATCINSGYIEATCKYCHEKFIEEVLPIDPDNHSYTTWLIDVDPTCTTTGREISYCDYCHVSYITRTAEPSGHNYQLAELREPTCTEGGYQLYRCSICGDEVRETLNPLGHMANGYPSYTEPTCTHDGYYFNYCTRCHQDIVLEETRVPALDHEWSEWETLSEGDCEHDRIEERHCTQCDQLERNIVAGEHNYVIKEEVPGTCLHEGYESFICSVCGYEPEEREILDIDPFNHEGVKQLIIDSPATTESDGYGHYEWSCCHYNSPDEPRVIIPKLTVDNSKNVVSDIIGINTEEPQPGEEKSAVEEAMDNISNDTLLDVAQEVNKSFGEIAALEGVSEEKKQEYIQTVQAATESAVIAGAKLDNSADEAAAISQKMPENSPIKMDDKLEKFYKLQYELILGKQTDPTKSVPMNAPFRAGETNSGGIDYTEGADIYKQVGDFIDNTVGHMTDAASMVRVCSNEKVTTAVNDYIDRIGVKSFRAFDKREADLEFAANAYKAILVNMQEQSIANLNSSYEELSKELSGVALSELETEYNAQLEVCNDLDAFEWVIIEIMREKYDSILNSRLEKGEITYETYVGQFVGDSEADLENFKGIYTNIFYGWALGKDAETYGYANSYGITLQELTDATISSTTLRQKDMDLSKGPSTSEIVVAACFGTACLLTVAGLVWVEVLKRRKGV